MLLDLLRSYLGNRKQYVSVNNINSDLSEVKHSVPQGSVLVPILFILFINDICHFLEPFKCVLFANDTTLMTSNRDCTDLMNNLDQIEKISGK